MGPLRDLGPTLNNARLHQVLLLGTFLPLCWLLMMAVHELGHVLAAWLTDGTVMRVVLYPLAISRTDVSPNPRPLIVVWGGPLVGVLLPILGWAFGSLMRIPFGYLLRFFAGFCLVANGAYLSIGSFEGIGDAGVMLQHGSPAWMLWGFGLVMMPMGFLLWHRQGPYFGLGASPKPVDARAAFLSLGLLIMTLLLEFSLSPRF